MMSDDQDAILLVFTNLPDRRSAMKLAQTLVEQRLAACVNVLGGCDSVYRWQGVVEQADEVPVLIKTRAARYGEVEAAIRELHPYELPEVLAVPVAQGLPGYLAWVTEQTEVPSG